MSNLVAFPNAQEFTLMKEMARMAINSGFLPAAIKTPEQACIIIMKGRELGIPPMLALSKISVIQGKPATDAELMLGLIFQKFPNAVINYIENNDKKCVIEAKRPGATKFSRFEFTIEDAKTAGLLSKNSWKQYPGDMIKWRCVSKMARSLFADAISGLSHTREELGAEIDDEGNVVSLPEEKPRDVSPAENAIKAAQEEAGLESAGDFVSEFPNFKGLPLRKHKDEFIQQFIIWLDEKAPANIANSAKASFLRVNYARWCSERGIESAYDAAKAAQ